MLLDSDNDIINDSYREWFDKIYTSFTEQIHKQLTEYMSGMSQMMFTEVSKLYSIFFPFHAVVYYLHTKDSTEVYEREEKTTYKESILIDITEPDETCIKKAVSEAMTILVNIKDFDYTTIGPIELH